MHIIKQSVHKSASVLEKAGQAKNPLIICYGNDAPYIRAYIWHEDLKEQIKEQFHQAIRAYSSEPPTLILWVNKTEKEIQWLLDLINEDNYILDSWIYCQIDDYKNKIK